MAGYGAKRAGILKAGDASVINTLIIYLTFPALIFLSVHGKSITTPILKAPFLIVGLELIMMLAAYFAARLLKLDRRTTGSLILVSTFGNTGFLGYPVTAAAFCKNGQAMLAAVMIDQFGMSILLNVGGSIVAAGFSGAEFEWSNIIDFLKTPLLPMTAVAIILRNVHIPIFVESTLSYLAAGTVPLAMILIGLNLNTGSIKHYPGAVLVALILKMVILPVIVFFTLPKFGLSGTVYKVAMMECAMPTAALTGVISARFGTNGAFASAVIFVTTLASIIAIPYVLSVV